MWRLQKEDLEKAWPQFEESQNWYSKAEALISEEEKKKELKQLPSPDAPQTVISLASRSLTSRICRHASFQLSSKCCCSLHTPPPPPTRRGVDPPPPSGQQQISLHRYAQHAIGSGSCPAGRLLVTIFVPADKGVLSLNQMGLRPAPS